jgi:hypothetical protein
MTTLITVYHNGTMIVNEIGSYEFVGMKKDNFFVKWVSDTGNLVGLVRERLGWKGENFDVWLEGWIDLGSSNGPWMKMKSAVCNENEWTTYVGVIMMSEFRAMELVATRVGRNIICDEISRSPTMSEAIDECPLNVQLCLLNHGKYWMMKGLHMSLPLMEVMKWSIIWNNCQEVLVMLLMKRVGWPRWILNQLLCWSVLVKHLLLY